MVRTGQLFRFARPAAMPCRTHRMEDILCRQSERRGAHRPAQIALPVALRRRNWRFAWDWQASKQHVSRMENGERSRSIDLLIELSCILHVSTDYLLMGSEPSKEEVKNDLLSIISELSRIAKKL